MIKVSIIVPVYNSELYLERCLKSITNQTLTEIEIILVDDASTDKSPKICDEWSKKDSRIQVVHKTINEGLGMARNTGLKYASGEYFTFVDSDDFVEIETYSIAYEKAIENDIDFCYFQFKRFPGKDKYRKMVKECIFRGREEIKYFQLELLGPLPNEKIDSRFGMSVCMGIFRRKLVMDTGILFESEREFASEDMIFHLQVLPYVNSVCILPLYLYNYYVNPHSISTSYSVDKRLRLLNLLRKEKKILDSQFVFSEYKCHYFTEQVRILRVLMKYESRSNTSLVEKHDQIDKILSDKLFVDLFNDDVIKEYRLFIRILLLLMKYKAICIIIFLYGFNKKP